MLAENAGGFSFVKYIRVVGIFQRAHATRWKMWKMNSDSDSDIAVEGKLIKLAFRTNSAALAAL